MHINSFTHHITQQLSKKNTQPPPQTKPPPPPQQQQQSGQLIYADLTMSDKKPRTPGQGQHHQSLQASLAPGEVTYTALQNQQTAP